METRMEPDEARSPVKDLQATIRNLTVSLPMASDSVSSLQQQSGQINYRSKDLNPQSISVDQLCKGAKEILL